jgi:diazepam-binding inhibitor (GABA receptor modulator, acyl-CoA-binding protein)
MNFNEAAEAVTNLAKRPDNETLLKLYSFYKQGTDGNVTGSRPGMIDFKGRAKFDAWKKLEGMSKDDAQKSYVNLVQDLLKKDRA